MRGTIALDIDGTLTAGDHLSPNVIAYLKNLVDSGWRLVFITGRTFRSGMTTLHTLPFTYYLAVQNGAIILEMPTRQILTKKYLDRSIFTEMDAICQGEPSDFVVYGGFENQDHCFYRPQKFHPDIMHYLHRRVEIFKEIWHPVESYDQMALETFPSIKCFGLYKTAKVLGERIEERLGLHVPVIKDPFGARHFREDFYVVQATHRQITKGQALKDVIDATSEKGFVIAAGDDYNDVPMWKVADVSVVMETAPKDLLELADIIAPSAEQDGIIKGLDAAILRRKA